MSPIVAAFLAHLAGLLRPDDWPAAAPVLVALPLAAVLRAGRRGAARLCAGIMLAALVVGGGLRGATAAARDARCLADLRAAHPVRLIVREALAPGRPGTTLWRHRRCQLVVRVQPVVGEARAGDVVAASGRIVSADRGARLIDASLSAVPGQSPHRQWVWRAVVERALDAAFGGGAPAALARALVTGDASRLEPVMRDRWAAAGLVHMLSVSGLHVSLLIDGVRGLLARGVPLVVAEAAALGVVAGYVWLLGWPAPATRAAAVAGVAVAARRLQRPTDPWACWAIACAAPLHDARTAHDLGYQLSVLGAAGLVAGGLVWRRLRDAARRRLAGDASPPRRARAAAALRPVWQGGVVGVVTAVVTLPLSLWTFGQWSVVAPLTNLVASPLVGLVQPLLFLVVLAAPLPGLSRAIGWVARVPMALADGVATAGAHVPGAVLAWAPTAGVAVTGSLALAAFVLALAGRAARRRRRLRLAGVVLVAAPWGGRLLGAGEGCALHVLDVGQGDALALRTGRGRWVLVDAGPAWRGGDAARRVVVPYLRRRGGEVALLALSHADLDHAGGAVTVVEALRPAVVWDPGVAATARHYAALLGAVADGDPGWHRPAPGRRLRIDDLELEVLAPDAAWRRASRDANRASLMLRATCLAEGARPAVRFLLTGDADAAAERRLLELDADVRADVLKVPHHGSRTSSSAAFLDAVEPVLAVASIGRGNRFGHPAAEVVARYIDRGIPLLRTDRDGSIVVRAGPSGPEVVAP